MTTIFLFVVSQFKISHLFLFHCQIQILKKLLEIQQQNYLFLSICEMFTAGKLCALLVFPHRIINDRIEKSIKGRRIGHTGERGLLCISTTVVMLAGLVLPWCRGGGGERRVEWSQTKKGV